MRSVRTKYASFSLNPVNELQLSSAVYGVRYPETALRELDEAGIAYRGWVPNFEVPEVFSRFRLTVHVPRRPYTRQLPGIPTIRPFEALACGIPLISAPWDDIEGLFRVGEDFLMVNDGREMSTSMQDLLCDPSRASRLAASGLETIRSRHTCAHRVDQLFDIYAGMQPVPAETDAVLAQVES